MSNMGIFNKLVRGDSYRKTRLHDEKGNRVGYAEMMHILPAVISYAKQYFSAQSKSPWLCYNSMHVLDRLIEPTWNVIEFGSGMSTLYFGARAKNVVSIEHSAEWGARVEKLIFDSGLKNIQLRNRSWPDYEDCSEWKDGYFDFCLVDGVKRLGCVKSVLPKIRRGGYIFLDDSDVIRDEERREAQRIITEVAKERGAPSPVYFVDFAPALLHPKECMLARL